MIQYCQYVACNHTSGSCLRSSPTSQTGIFLLHFQSYMQELHVALSVCYFLHNTIMESFIQDLKSEIESIQLFCNQKLTHSSGNQ